MSPWWSVIDVRGRLFCTTVEADGLYCTVESGWQSTVALELRVAMWLTVRRKLRAVTRIHRDSVGRTICDEPDRGLIVLGGLSNNQYG